MVPLRLWLTEVLPEFARDPPTLRNLDAGLSRPVVISRPGLYSPGIWTLQASLARPACHDWQLVTGTDDLQLHTLPICGLTGQSGGLGRVQLAISRPGRSTVLRGLTGLDQPVPGSLSDLD